MKKHFSNLLKLNICFLCVCMLLNSMFIHYNAQAATGSAQLKKQISALESKLAETKKERDKITAKINANKNQVKSLEQEIAELDEDITAISNELIAIDALIAEWEIISQQEKENLEQLKDKRQNEQENFDKMIRMSYEYGSDSYFEIIFGARSFGDFLQRLDLISYHLNYNEKVLKKLDQTTKELELSQQSYEESRKSIDDYRISQQNLSVQLEEKIQEANLKKGQLLTSLESLMTADDLINQDIEELLKETQEKSKELKIVEASEMEQRLKEQNNNGNSTNKNKVTASSSLAGTSDYIWPLPSEYKRISSGFAYRINPVTGKPENHNGIDLPAPSRTPIYAVAGGTIVVAGKKGGYGNCVTINHGDGHITLYGHMSAINCSSGDTVMQGDVIGYVGTTGLSTGNHLHFTIYKDGVAQDPGKYIS